MTLCAREKTIHHNSELNIKSITSPARVRMQNNTHVGAHILSNTYNLARGVIEVNESVIKFFITYIRAN